MSGTFPKRQPLGKMHVWEVATWENTRRKLPLGKIPLGKYFISYLHPPPSPLLFLHIPFDFSGKLFLANSFVHFPTNIFSLIPNTNPSTAFSTFLHQKNS